MDKKPLYALANLIRSAVNANENTAERVGRLFVEIIDNLGDWEALSQIIDQYWKNSEIEFLSKTHPDTAKGLITFLQGLMTGEYVPGLSGAYISPEGNAELRELLVRLMATLGSLRVNGDSEFRGNLSSEEFISGFLGGKGWAIIKETVLNALGVPETKYTAEFDNVVVRGILRVFELVVSQLLGENDNRVFTAMMEVDHYDPATGTVWLDTCNGKYFNPFRAGDYIMVQQFNGMPSEENNHYVTKHYELVITEVGSGGLSDGEDRLDWVRFKNFTAPMEGLTPEDLITKGDTFTRVDNATDPDRKGIVTITSVGKKTPYMDILYGLKTDPDNALKGRLGNLEGIKHRLFGWLHGFGELLMNLYAVGDFRLAQTGESLNAKVEMTRAQYSTAYQQITHELTEQDNFLRNGAFRALSSVPSLIPDWDAHLPSTSRIITVDGLPLMMNIDTVRTLSSIAKADDFDGRTMLHLQNASVSQKNALIRKPGKHKVYATATDDPDTETSEAYTEERDKVYVSMRFLAKTDGVLTIGMPGTKPDAGLPLLPASESITSSFEWQMLQWSGEWDGTGDFTIGYTGEMWISLVAVTDRPLEDFRKEMSTQILQTASNIRLLGRKIDKTNDRIADLGITLDNELERIELYVNTKTSEVSEQLGLRIDGLDESLRLYAQKQTDDHEASMGLIADLKTYTVGLYNDYLKKDGTGQNNLWIALDSAKATITTQVDTLRTDLADAERTLDGKISGLDTKTQQTAKRLEDTLNATIGSVETSVGNRIDGLEGKWTAWVAKDYKDDKDNILATLRSEITAKEGSILLQVKNDYYDPLSGRMDSADDAISEHSGLIAANASAIELLEGSINLTVTTAINEAKEGLVSKDTWQDFVKYPHLYSGFINTLSVNLSSAHQEISLINETLTDHGGDISSLKVGQREVSTTVLSLKNKTDGLDTAIKGMDADIKERLQSLTRDLSGVSDTVNGHGSSITDLTASVNSLKGIVASLSPEGEPIDFSGFMVRDDFAMLFSQHVADEKIAKIATSVQYDPDTKKVTSNILLTADKIRFEGYTTINDSFSVDTDGTVRIKDLAYIGGFRVDGTGLTNGPLFTNDACIVFRNDAHGCFAGIGGNVLPAISGARGVARFENYDESDWWGLGHNYALLVGARGSSDNCAIAISGGYVSGLALKTQIIGHDEVTQSTVPSSKSVTIGRDVNSVYVSTQFNWRSSSGKGFESKTREIRLTLPDMQPYDDGHVIFLKRGTNNSNYVRVIPGKSYRREYNSSTMRWDIKSGNSYIIYDNEERATPSDPLSVNGCGDAMCLIYHRGLQWTSGGTTYYGAWIQHKFPREW